MPRLMLLQTAFWCPRGDEPCPIAGDRCILCLADKIRKDREDLDVHFGTEYNMNPDVDEPMQNDMLAVVNELLEGSGDWSVVATVITYPDEDILDELDRLD